VDRIGVGGHPGGLVLLLNFSFRIFHAFCLLLRIFHKSAFARVVAMLRLYNDVSRLGPHCAAGRRELHGGITQRRMLRVERCYC
jgi:hypothetical protein